MWKLLNTSQKLREESVSGEWVYVWIETTLMRKGQTLPGNSRLAYRKDCIYLSGDHFTDQGENLAFLKDSSPTQTKTALTYIGRGVVNALDYVNCWTFSLQWAWISLIIRRKKITSKIYFGEKNSCFYTDENINRVISPGVRLWPLVIC